MEQLRTPPPEAGPPDPREARRIPALLAGYWAFGQYWGIWVIVIARLNTHHDLTYEQNGVQLMVLSIVAVLVMALVAPRFAHVPLGITVPASLITLGIGSAMMALLPTGGLFVAFIVVGAGNGLIDVFMNVDAQRVEMATRKPVLQWLHASYAAGGVTGAGIGGLTGALDLDFSLGLLAGAAALLLTAAWNALRGSRQAGSEAEKTVLSLSAFRRHRGLWVAGLVVLFAFLVEGSMDTWSGLYLQDHLGASAGQAAVAFAAFSASLCLGRLFAGRVLFGLGPRPTIVISGVGAAIGGAIATFTDSPLVVGVAFLLMGFSIAAAIPAGFGLIESLAPRDQTNSIAAVTTVGYSGFIWSPPIFGYIAAAFDLRTAMAVIVSSTLGIIVAGALASRRRLTPREDAAAPV